MRIGVDFDDVLNQFMKSFLKWHNRSYDTTLRVNQIDRYDFQDIVGISRPELVTRVDEFVYSLDHKLMDPESGALKVVPMLARSHELQIITSRPERYKSQVQEWVANYFDGAFTRVHLTNHWGAKDPRRVLSKADVCSQMGIKVMIDDAPETASICIAKGLPVIMFDKPWNGYFPKHDLLTRVTNWEEAESVLETYK